MSPDSRSDGHFEASEAQSLIGGRYALGELLGRGGMAEVRKGTDTRLGRTVAIKRLRTDLASDVTFQARFRREAQSAASLNHPAIVAVYDTGEVPASDGSGISQPYIVMEYVAGRTLRDILREGRKILPERALEIASGVLSALDYSHRAGIIHRDIKPGNVMLTPAGDVKVMDFGIARAISDASSTMTQTAAVVGTAQYLSPEQARGEAVDSRSDVYSAGCLLYELLTGRPPFVGDSPVAVAYQHVREQAAPPSDHDTELPPEVDAIVMKSLAKRVEDRYQSAAAMRGDIERYLAGHPVHVAPPPPPVLPPPTIADPTTVVTPVPPPQEEYDEHDRGTRPGLLVFLALLLVIVLGLAAYLLPKMFASPTDQVQVPRLAGLSDNQARAKISDAGLDVGTVNRDYSSKVAANHVISQDPAADEFVDKNSTVNYTLSLGTHPTKVPNIVGDSRTDAQSELQSAHLNGVFKKVDSDQPQGTVVSTDPPVGTQVARNSDVTVSISRGPQAVPDVVGMSEDDAVQKLKDLGFDPRVSDDASSTQPKGTVTGQTPPAGTHLQQGSPVFITVSTFEPTTPPTSSPTTEPTSPPTSLPTSPPPSS
ncbi:MAG TPA: Stk1 family PASTA domain-containing Ser/Thr kinase [Nocardioides sp.]|uniref:Stk1 family PASTA domain-containing Ser/Thr kinase n=1 Tax=Nocardioides sp. TaxID=35761 RepID=UPI002F401F9C